MNKIKLSLVLAMTMTCLITMSAQSFKIAKTSGKVIIEVSEAIIEAYNGNEIVITTQDEIAKDEDSEAFKMRMGELTATSPNYNNDSKSKGLRVVNGSGLVDNTGLGLSVKIEGNNIKVAQVGKNPVSNLSIKIPKGMPISFAYTKMEGGLVEFKNIESEIEATSQYNEFKLTDITGALTMHAVYGGVTGTFTKSPKGPISIISVYSDVDLDMPNNLKADVNFSTPYGDVFAAPEFDIVVDKKQSKIVEKNIVKIERPNRLNEKSIENEEKLIREVEMNSGEFAKDSTDININVEIISKMEEGILKSTEIIKKNLSLNSPKSWLTDDIKGKLNGGGFNLILKANYGNIYLR